jgi:hypothetical protein
MSERVPVSKEQWRLRWRVGLAALFVVCSATIVFGTALTHAGDSARTIDAAVFSTQRTAGDQLPGTAGAAERSSSSYLSVGIDPTRSHRLAMPLGSSSRWIAPTDDGRICLVNLPPGVDGPAVACSADESEPNVNYTEREDGQTDVFGYAPDDDYAVVLGFADGSRQSLPIRQNAFGTTSKDNPTSATFTSSTGAKTIRLAP